MAQEIADSKLLDTWGSSGTKIEPDISKIIEGWQLGEQPPHEYMNWLQNTFGSKLNHILKNGVATWNNETEYLAGSSVQHNGNVWLCKATNTNSEPTELNANWEKVAINKDLTVTVDTLSDLRSISYPANTVWASGYHAKNDGSFGSHIFRLKGVKTTEVDNSGTIIVATIGGIDYVYELQYSGAVNVKWFGAVGDGITDDTNSLQAFLEFIGTSGDTGVSENLIIKTTEPISITTSMNYKIDFNDSTIKPDFSLGINSGVVGILSISNSVYTDSSYCSITGLNIDGSLNAYFETVSPEDRRGLVGLDISNFGSINVSDYNANDLFYGYGLKLSLYNKAMLSNVFMANVGSKYKPTQDDTSTYDAVGDGIYLGNFIGEAKTIMKNISLSSYDTKYGRGGIVVENLAGITATSHYVNITNISINNYHRSIHQEDGGISTFIINNGTFAGFSNALFNLGSEVGDKSYIVSNSEFIVDVPFAYGGTSGVINFQSSSTAVLSNCKITYLNSVQERGNMHIIDSYINLGAFNLTPIASLDVYIMENVTVDSDGGCIMWMGTSNIKIKYCTINNNVDDSILSVIHAQNPKTVNIDNTIFNNADYYIVIEQGYCYINNSIFNFTGQTTDKNMGGGSNSNIFLKDCYIYSHNSMITLYGDGSMDNGISDCTLLNIHLLQINGGGDADASDNILYSGNKFIYNDSYSITNVIDTYAPMVTFIGNIFIDKKTAQDIVVPADSISVAITGLSNVLRKSTAITKI